MLTLRQAKAISAILRERLAAGDAVRLNVPTDSMLPMIAPGDSITVRGLNIARVARGDIILYEKDDTLHVHRLLYKKIKENRIIFTTKGDACIRKDVPLKAESVLGRVVAIQKRRKTINLQMPSRKAINCIFALFSSAQDKIIRAVRGY